MSHLSLSLSALNTVDICLWSNFTCLYFPVILGMIQQGLHRHSCGIISLTWRYRRPSFCENEIIAVVRLLRSCSRKARLVTVIHNVEIQYKIQYKMLYKILLTGSLCYKIYNRPTGYSTTNTWDQQIHKPFLAVTQSHNVVYWNAYQQLDHGIHFGPLSTLSLPCLEDISGGGNK